MKSYEEIADRIYEKGDEILRAKKKRTAIIRKTSLVVSEICAGVLICFAVWKTGDMRFAPDQKLPEEMISEPESTSDDSGTVSTPENNDNVIYVPEKPDSTTAISDDPAAPQTSADKIGEDQQLSVQTAPPVQMIPQTTLKTDELPEPIQTTICTSVQEENEGSFYMKKLAAFCTSAIVIASQAAPIVGNAEYEISDSRLWAGEKAIFAKMDSGEFDVDIDGNGEFNEMDGFMLHCYVFNGGDMPAYRTQDYYTFDQETIDRINAIADYDGNGTVNTDDCIHLIRYFISNHNFTREQLELTYYDPDYVVDPEDFRPYDNAVYGYVMRMRSSVNALLAGYYIVEEMYEDGTINLDFNLNGQLDTGDIYTLNVFRNKYLEFKEENRTLEDRTIDYKENKYISSEEWDRCKEALSHYPVENDYYPVYGACLDGSSEKIASIQRLLYYSSCYISAHIEMKPEYFTEEYYAERYGDKYYCPESWITSAIVQQGAARIGVTPDSNAWLKYNKDELNDIFVSYCRDVERGARPAPDVNMDGEVDLDDYFTINTYLLDLIGNTTGDSAILSADILENINENLDINGNGTTKDMYDILTIQMYVIKYADTSDFDSEYQRYQESLGEDSKAEIESLSYDEQVKILADIERNYISGDANCDGEVDIADATLVLQFIGNGDNYSLSEQGEKNADVYENGSGVTAMDALSIQRFDAKQIKSLPESYLEIAD